MGEYVLDQLEGPSLRESARHVRSTALVDLPLHQTSEGVAVGGIRLQPHVAISARCTIEFSELLPKMIAARTKIMLEAPGEIEVRGLGKYVLKWRERRLRCQQTIELPGSQTGGTNDILRGPGDVGPDDRPLKIVHWTADGQADPAAVSLEGQETGGLARLFPDGHFNVAANGRHRLGKLRPEVRAGERRVRALQTRPRGEMFGRELSGGKYAELHGDVVHSGWD